MIVVGMIDVDWYIYFSGALLVIAIAAWHILFDDGGLWASVARYISVDCSTARSASKDGWTSKVSEHLTAEAWAA